MALMTFPALRRRGGLALAGGLAAALLTGCTGSPDESGSPGPSGASGNPAGKGGPRSAVLLADALRTALITETELPSYQAQDISPSERRPETDRAECSPLAEMTASGAARTPEAADWASRSFLSSGTPGLTVTVSLFSYQGEGARTTLANVRKALKACANGFSTSGNTDGGTVKYVDVKSEDAPEGGDEAVAWTMTGTTPGNAMPVHLTAVRQGRNVAVFFALNLLEPKEAQLPDDLHARQVAKLAKAVAAAGKS
ncbi:hypothetical protein [Streptomyces sp. NPDC059176]|uniref:hypothetical protein n=1 Tax=unclassified Streptomyces TaxID=2593676 RepID=UPI003677D497